MGENISSGPTLFDLLARDWLLQSAVVQTVFNHEDTAVIFRLASGNLALATTEDAESPKKRTHVELESGRATIKPRETPVMPLITPQIALKPSLPVVRFGAQGFAAVDEDGALQHVAPNGEVTSALKPAKETVTSLSSSSTGHLIALGLQKKIALYETKDMKLLAEVTMGTPVTCQAISSDFGTLAAWGGGILYLIDLQNPSAKPQEIECGGEITEISWRKSGSHLACASADKSFYIINCATGAAQRVEDFPSPVANTAFCEAGNALVASGAFRLVSWDSRDLPENDQPGTPLETGKAGFVVINTIAAHPERNLVATGYANGLLTIASIGQTDEMMLHQENATEVSSLCWSKTGEHLTIGYASGKAAIVTFPEQMFK